MCAFVSMHAHACVGGGRGCVQVCLHSVRAKFTGIDDTDKGLQFDMSVF